MYNVPPFSSFEPLPPPPLEEISRTWKVASGPCPTDGLRETFPVTTSWGRVGRRSPAADSHWLQIEHGSTFLGAFVLTPRGPPPPGAHGTRSAGMSNAPEGPGFIFAFRRRIFLSLQPIHILKILRICLFFKKGTDSGGEKGGSQ